MAGTILDRANRSKIQYGDGPPDSNTRGNIYIDNTNQLFYFKVSSTWYTPSTSVTPNMDDTYNIGSSIVADSGPITITVPDTSNNNGLVITQNDSTNNVSSLTINSNTTSLITDSGFPSLGESILFSGSNSYKVLSASNTLYIGTSYNGVSAAYLNTASSDEHTTSLNLIAKKEHLDTGTDTSVILTINSINNSAGHGIVNITANGSTYGSYSGYVNIYPDIITFKDANLTSSSDWTNAISLSANSTNWDDAYSLLGDSEGSLLDLIIAASLTGGAASGVISIEKDVTVDGLILFTGSGVSQGGTGNLTFTFTDTTYSSSTGISINGSNEISNSGVLTVAKNGETGLTGNITLSGAGETTLDQSGNNIEISSTDTMPVLAQYAIGVGDGSDLLSGDTSKLSFNSDNQLFIGTGTPVYLDTTDSSLYVHGASEFVSTVDFRAATRSRASFYVYSNFYLQGGTFIAIDDSSVNFGSSLDSSLLWDHGCTPDKLVLGLGSDSNALILCRKVDIGTDWNQSLQTNPTLYIQSGSTSVNYNISFSHDQTDGLISTGAGSVKFNSASSSLDGNSHTLNNLLAANFGLTTTAASYDAGTLNINLTTGKPIQEVSITGNVTTVSITNPSGVTTACVEITASGGDYTISGFTGFYWYGSNPDSETVTIPDGSKAILSIIYKGSSTYSGSIIVGN